MDWERKWYNENGYELVDLDTFKEEIRGVSIVANISQLMSSCLDKVRFWPENQVQTFPLSPKSPLYEAANTPCITTDLMRLTTKIETFSLSTGGSINE